MPINGDFDQRVLDHAPILYGETRSNAEMLTDGDQRMPCCGCYKVVCSTEASCCPGTSIGLTPTLNLCGGCVWFACFFCVCADAAHPGDYNCSDLKGNYYALVALGKGKFGCFTESTFASKGAELPIACYFE